MNKRLPVFLTLASVCLGILAGCSSGPMRGNSADAFDSSGASVGSTGLGATGAANSTSSAAGPGTATGLNRGGGR